MAERSHDWFAQARRDLETARWQLQGGFYEWVCFTCQQAAEKAVKALYQRLHAVAWGHAVSRLLNELPEEIKPDQELIEAAIYLDRYYIQTRFPNGFERGAPQDYYTEKDAQEAIEYAERVLEFCDRHLYGRPGDDSGTEKIATEIKRTNPDVLEISLFGSLARGDYAPGSDADLFVLVQEDGQRPLDRIPRFLRLFLNGPVDTDILAYTPTEVETMQCKGNPLLAQIEREKVRLA